MIEMVKLLDRRTIRMLDTLDGIERRLLILEGSRQVEEGPRRNQAPDELKEGDIALWDALRQWRKERAEADGIKPFHVFGNRVLAAIVATRPADKFELSKIRDFGTNRMERYGDDVMGMVGEHRTW